MADRMFIKPARPDMVIRDPRNMEKLKETGEWKPRIGPAGRYWRRRVIQGDVIMCNPPVEKKVAATVAKTKKED